MIITRKLQNRHLIYKVTSLLKVSSTLPVVCETKININQSSNKFHIHDKSLKRHTSPRNTFLLDEASNEILPDSSCNKYTYRTVNCGELRIKNIGHKVALCGWLQYKRLNKFLIIRDSYGHTQLLIKEQDAETSKIIENLPYESIIKIEGTVLSRPKEMINTKQATGEIEVLIESLTVLNEAKQNLPFNIREFQKAKESLRMQYRYLDLRFPEMQRNLRIRSQFIMSMREFLVNKCQFVDVETPTLFKATPGGAQEFIVPTRFPGQFYSLVQSPQQFKQMLMAGGIDRYFQIARCYRDEGCRSDRQPEFTQLDVEMSFTDRESIMKLIEDLLRYSWPKSLSPLPLKFSKLSFKEAMENFGSDKPDIRFEFHLQNITDILNTNENILTDNFGAFCLVFQNPYNSGLSNSLKDRILKSSKEYKRAKLILNKISDLNKWSLQIQNLLGQVVVKKLTEVLKLQDNCVIALAYGNYNEILPLLGSIRVEYVDALAKQGHKIIKDGFHPLWITDFPLFEVVSEKLNSTHHPFTAPCFDDLSNLAENPLNVKSQAYDLVLNGNEVGGGSIRIHNPELQEKIFKMLNIDVSTMQYMLDMLKSGCPPHGGIALGLDRLLATLLNTLSIRDVIAFPKSFEGRDLISGAPSPINENDKKLYNLEIVFNKS